MTLDKHLRKLRLGLGLTQQELADLSGVGIATICQLEKGKRKTAAYKTVIRLARVFGKQPEELIPVSFPRRRRPPAAATPPPLITTTDHVGG